MANTFKDISQFTLKSAATGTEEFQVSATEKVTAQQIANKVQLSKVIMSGFSALNFTGIEKIKDSNSLLGALAILYDLLGKGNIKMVSNGSTEYGFVSMGNVSGTTHGFGWLLSISEKAIYIKNDFTSPNPSTLNNIQWVNAIKTGEKVSLDSGGIQTVTVTNFQTNVWNNDAGTNVFSSVPVGGMVVFKSAADATSGPGEALMGYAIKISSIIASYVGMTTTNSVNVTPTLYTHKSSSLYATKWQKLPDADNGGVQVVEITDFAIPSVNITKDGQSFLFYANDASNIPNSNHGATSFVGVAIASPIFITGDQRLLYYMMVDTAKAMFYTGYANLEDDVVTWSDTPVTRLGQAVQVTAFTEGALLSLLYTFKAGDFIPFYTGNVTASTANQFPESGIFNGFISMGSNEGDYFQIFAFKTGSPKAYIGACIGSTTQWTALGNSSEGSGPEDIASTLHEDSKYVQASPGAGMGTSTIITLDRALKSTDMILITWRKSSASVPDAEIAGSTIINPGAYSYDVALEYIENANSDYYGLFIDQSHTEVSSTQLSFYAVSDGAAYGPSYLLTGIYNISGK